MAVIGFNSIEQATPKRLIVWSGVTNADTFAPFEAPFGLSIAGAVQVGGTFGGASVALQASLDGVTYFTVSDLLGTQISVTAAGLRDFTTSALFLRPLRTGGDGTTSLSVWLRLPLLRAE
jgi:hypothetical protein